jgi:hypothetical protein
VVALRGLFLETKPIQDLTWKQGWRLGFW